MESENLICRNEIETPLGRLTACATGAGICLLLFSDKASLPADIAQLERSFQHSVTDGENEHLLQLEKELAEYFSGTRKDFTLPLVLEGTGFQKRVWQSLQHIHYGQTVTYTQQALLLQSPQSIRAVAGANGSNRIYILIPCHRVIGANGTLTGYGGGLWRKKYLLELEAGIKSHLLF